MPALNALASRPYDGTTTFADRVHFVHIYIIEPHPKAPDMGPYMGFVSEASYSDRGQPRTYADRVAYARDARALISGNQIQLVDDLTPGRSVNPVWCTYGTCPNCAFLVRKDGTIATVQKWFDARAMEEAIRRLLQ